MQTFVVTEAAGIKAALQQRIRYITVKVPEGGTTGQFIADMVIEAATIPEMAEAYDLYELEAIIRDMIVAH